MIQELLDAFQRYERDVSGFLGFNICYGPNADQTGLILSSETKFKMMGHVKNHAIEMLHLIAGTVLRYHRERKHEPIHRLGIIEEVVLNLLEGKESYSHKLFDFMQSLKGISATTYESDCSTLGVIVFKRKVAENTIRKQLDIRNIDYISLEGALQLEDLMEDKHTYTMINGKSLAFVVNSDYKVIGMAKKRADKRSIKDEIFNYFGKKDKNLFYGYVRDNFATLQRQGAEQDDVLVFAQLNDSLQRGLSGRGQVSKKPDFYFIEIENQAINWYITHDILISYSKGKWKYRDMSTLKLSLLDKMFIGDIADAANNIDHLIEIIHSIDKLINMIKRLVLNKKGALYLFLRERGSEPFVYRGRRAQERLERIVPEGLLINKRTQPREYERIIRGADGAFTHIDEFDVYLLELISAVDGAVLFDSSFNVLSYGEMVNNSFQGRRSGSGPQADDRYQVQGTRTAAARVASQAGIAIKVSEDGDVDIWFEGERILKI